MNKPRSKPLVVIQSYENRNSGKDVVQTTTIVSERLSSLNHRETLQEKSSTPVSRQGSNASVLSPPPPPPLPPEDVDDVDSSIKSSNVTTKQQKVKAPPPPVPQKTSNSSNQPPPCPPPDYDTLSLSSTTSTLPKKSPPMNGYTKKELRHSLSHNGDAVEMESLESYKLNQQNDIKPKPPNTYFKPKSNGLTTPMQNGTVSNSTLTKQRPVSVIIGEYPSGTSRKQPKKLDFLNSSRENAYKTPNNESIVREFASELAQTLNRSNLRKKTESMENLLNHPQIKANSNGSVRISVNSNLSKHLAKSTNDLLSLDNFSKTLSNRVTISIPSNDKKAETPSGILKHNSGNHNLPSHRSILHQKSITFGEIPTVINDQPLHVT